MSIKIDVLSTESVERLRSHIPLNPSKLTAFDHTVVDDLDLVFLPTEYSLNESHLALDWPAGDVDKMESDKENCKRLLAALPGLSRAQATDERLWVTLSIFYCREYALMRWPLPDKDLEVKARHIRDHWFAEGLRGRVRNNSVGRLWWTGWIASNMPNMRVDAALSVLFVNSEFLSSIVGRNTSTAALNVTEVILELSKSASEKGHGFHREKFREFMKEVDFQSGHLNLTTLDKDKIWDILEPIYKEKVAVDEPLRLV